MAHHLSNALAGQGNEVVFLGPRGCLVPSGYSRQYTLIEDTQSTVATRSGPGVSAEDTRIRELGRRILDRYRCEHALLVHPFYYAVGLMRAFHEVALPVSVYFHGYDLRSQLVGMRAAGQTANPPLWPGESLPERLLYTAAACDEVLANSRYTAGLFAPFRIEAPVRVTGCGIPLDRIRREVAQTTGYSAQERIQRRAALGLPRGSCLCYVGRLVPAKRVGRLLEICRDSRELCCVVIGEGPELASLQQMAERWGLRNRVHFAGKLEEAEKWTVLRAMDFVCLLSEPDDGTGAVEGFGIALLEGAAAGAVPVSSGSGGMGIGYDSIFH